MMPSTPRTPVSETSEQLPMHLPVRLVVDPHSAADTGVGEVVREVQRYSAMPEPAVHAFIARALEGFLVTGDHEATVEIVGVTVKLIRR